jgi:Short C-terminal domain
MADWISKLERAKALLDAGALTPEEYEEEKSRLLYTSSDRLVESSNTDKRYDEPNSHARWGYAFVACVIAIAVATSVYYLQPDHSPEMSVQETAPTPINIPPAPIPSPIAPAAKRPPAQEESGDGSGLFIRIGESGAITWKYYEGSVASGTVDVKERSANRISATLRYGDDPEGTISNIVLNCSAGKLSVTSDNLGKLALQKLTAKEAAELDY